jgi:toxin ParE1/3/4
MAQIIRSDAARRDIAYIWHFIAAHNATATDKLIDRFDHDLNLLAESPGLGQRRDDLLANLRSFPVGNYLLFYVPFDDGIELVRVAHGAQDLPRLFDH